MTGVNIFCAHCGNRLTLTTSGTKKKQADGTYKSYTKTRYRCLHNVRHPGECEGQSDYSASKMNLSTGTKLTPPKAL